MPTVLRFDPYRFFFYSSDAGFRPPELRRIGSIIIEHRKELLESWNEYFGK